MTWFHRLEDCVLWIQGVSAGHCATDGWVWVLTWVPLPI